MATQCRHRLVQTVQFRWIGHSRMVRARALPPSNHANNSTWPWVAMGNYIVYVCAGYIVLHVRYTLGINTHSHRTDTQINEIQGANQASQPVSQLPLKRGHRQQPVDADHHATTEQHYQCRPPLPCPQVNPCEHPGTCPRHGAFCAIQAKGQAYSQTRRPWQC